MFLLSRKSLISVFVQSCLLRTTFLSKYPAIKLRVAASSLIFLTDETTWSNFWDTLSDFLMVLFKIFFNLKWNTQLNQLQLLSDRLLFLSCKISYGQGCPFGFESGGWGRGHLDPNSDLLIWWGVLSQEAQMKNGAKIVWHQVYFENWAFFPKENCMQGRLGAVLQFVYLGVKQHD